MPRLFLPLILLALAACGLAPAQAADDPDTTIRQSQQVLAEQVAINGMGIPHKLLAEAQGVAIVPRVLKVGFVAGLRRGHGVVLTRDCNACHLILAQGPEREHLVATGLPFEHPEDIGGAELEMGCYECHSGVQP